jgi:hypothetical protein
MLVLLALNDSANGGDNAPAAEFHIDTSVGCESMLVPVVVIRAGLAFLEYELTQLREMKLGANRII